MHPTSRRGFLKTVGATLSAVGLSAASGSVPALAQEQLDDSVAPPAPIISPSSGDSRPRRTPITLAALQILVAEQLRAWVAQERQFTAYDVTRALRQARPGVNIVHVQVREIVHLFMASAVASQIYTTTPIDFPTGWAWLYHPSPA